MITYLQAVILGAVQGIAELFPVSSLGHSILIPALFHWNISQNSEYFLVFLVMTHLATALVLIGFFWDDWVKIITGIFRSLKTRTISKTDTYARLGWLLVVGTIPAGILGLLFQDSIKSLLSSPRLVALFLIANGIMLYAVERLTRTTNRKTPNGSEASDTVIAKTSWANTIKIGFAQCLALIPGFSRTGASLGGGLSFGLNHKDAARFAFLLATPIILAASVLKLPELFGNHFPLGPIFVGFIVSGIGAYLSVKFLTNYFKTKTLMPFAAYCVIVGVILVLVLGR
jgi:undecaprenyl-diphosphatase